MQRRALRYYRVPYLWTHKPALETLLVSFPTLLVEVLLGDWSMADLGKD